VDALKEHFFKKKTESSNFEEALAWERYVADTIVYL